MPTIQGLLEVVAGNVRLIFDLDFCVYYKYLITKEVPALTNQLELPYHGSHLTIINKNIHGRVNHWLLRKEIGTKYTVRYNTNIKIGGQSKNFTNFFFPVWFDEGFKIREKLGVRDKTPFHITICNTKSYAKSKMDN